MHELRDLRRRLPDRSVAGLRDEVVAATAGLAGGPRVLVFGCTHDADSVALADASTAVITLPWAAMVPPSFLDFALSRRHADGVPISGCAGQDCYERLGDEWVEQRIANQRDPNLRDESSLAAPAATPAPWRAKLRMLAAPLRHSGQAAAYAALVAIIGIFATSPAYTYLQRDQALLKLSFSHAGQPLQPCRRYTHEELTNTPFAERKATSCERGRWPVYVELDLDGEPLYRGTHQPAGLWDDGPSSVYARFEVPAGRHRLDARLRDGGAKDGFDYTGSRTVELAPGENFVVDFRAAEGGFTFDPPAPGAVAGGAP